MYLLLFLQVNLILIKLTKRPEMTAKNNSLSQKIGKIKDDWRCCDPSFEIYNESGKLKYRVHGECCQCGIFFKCFSRFYKTYFYIYEVNQSFDKHNAVGRIKREQKKALKALCTDTDNFEIEFPKSATAYDKLMIIGCALMIDYSYFENSS